MIAALRVAALLTNVGVLVGGPWWLGVPLWGAVAFAAICFWLSWVIAGRVPEGESADPMVISTARRLAERMGLEHPVFVRRHPGWMAGAARAPGGYGLVVGDEIEPEHREAVLAHELAHVAEGDLDWEPWTDGFARAVLPAVRAMPPFFLAVFPFFLFGAPLARLTELRADDRAAAVNSTYPLVLQEIASIVGSRATILYPSLAQRSRRSARRSMAKHS
jgi:hypothetical protein